MNMHTLTPPCNGSPGSLYWSPRATVSICEAALVLTRKRVRSPNAADTEAVRASYRHTDDWQENFRSYIENGAAMGHR